MKLVEDTMKMRFSGYKMMLTKDFMRNKYIYIMAVPMVIYYLLFHYLPMYGAVIAFKNFSIADGIIKSPWIGFEHFIRFFSSPYFVRITMNTFIINLYMLLFALPMPIIFSLLLNEIRQNKLKSLFQTISYLPHFISIIVVCGMIIQFTGEQGIINDFLASFNIPRSSLLLDPKLFRSIYVISGIWKEVGWEAIIYLSALACIDPTQYEAARIDGASKWHQMINVTIPGIIPTIVTMLILRIGQMMNVGFEKVMLLYNQNTYETADVISTYVYRVGLLNFNYDYSTAVGLFNSLINFSLLILANSISRKVNETSLW